MNDTIEKEMALLRELYLNRAKKGETVLFQNCPNCDHLLALYVKENSPQPLDPLPNLEEPLT